MIIVVQAAAKHFPLEFKKKIARLFEEGDSSCIDLAAEYGISKTSVSRWYRQYCLGCQTRPEPKEKPGPKEKHNSMDEILCLKKENEELKNEVAFLKKVVALFAKEIA